MPDVRYGIPNVGLIVSEESDSTFSVQDTYVKFIEFGGGRAVAVYPDSLSTFTDETLPKLHGIVLPDQAVNANEIYKAARQKGIPVFAFGSSMLEVLVAETNGPLD